MPKLGTSSLVVAAFVGPGTVLTCAAAGASFGYDLGWVLLFATVAAFVLQSFTAGTGILAGQGLGEALRDAADGPVSRAVLYGLVVLGLWVGCAAFELGNLVGAASGLDAVLGGAVPFSWIVRGLALAAALLLLFDVRALVRVLAVLVALMSVLFLATLALAPVDWGAAVRGLLVPSVPEGGLMTLVALIGTTIVTYNLFLHAAAAKRYWAGDVAREAWRHELRGMALFLPLGGLVSFAILAAGASLPAATEGPRQAADFAILLEPVGGAAARYLFGAGLFAAGLTSAVTAPLAAAAGIQEIFGWKQDTTDHRYRLVWATVLLTGLFFAETGFSPLQVIIAAQAANGLLLPLIAGFVLYVTYRQPTRALPGWYFGLGVAVTLICAGLGGRLLWQFWLRLIG